MRIVSLVNPLSGCDYHRVKQPLLHLHKRGLITGVPSGKTFEEDLQNCDLIVYNRIPHNIPLADLLSLRDKYGFKICVDLDDYWRLYPGHILERSWIDQEVEKAIVSNLKAADVVTCTNERLQDYIKPYNSNVFVVPNGLPFDEGQFQPQQHGYYDQGNGIDPEGFIYCGGGSHQWDVDILRRPMRTLADAKFQGKITLAGVTDAPVYTKMSNVLSANGRMLNFQKIPSEGLDTYMSLYDYGEVSLAPLVENSFNACKSNLKILEAGAKKMPIIVSNVGPYLEDQCPYIMRAERSIDFARWIKYCHENKHSQFLVDHANSLAEYVRHNYNIHNMNYLRLEAFTSVVTHE